MRKTISLIMSIVAIYSSSFAQKESKVLKVYSITEYIDGYVIKAIDTLHSTDTLNIISTKEHVKNKKGFEKITVGQKYSFEYEDYVKKMAAAPQENFVIRIKSTVIWSPKDGIKNRPVFSKNTKGLWIKNEGK